MGATQSNHGSSQSNENSSRSGKDSTVMLSPSQNDAPSAPSADFPDSGIPMFCSKSDIFPVPALKGRQKVGKLYFGLKEKLGQGAHAMVFRGYYDGLDVAAKRIQREDDNIDNVKKEVKMLIETVSGDNVIRYIGMETDKNFHYIVLELCEMSLKDHVQNLKEGEESSISLTSEDILQQSTKGVEYLHSLKIVHRDLKPQNILFAERCSRIRVVIADFDAAKKVRLDKNSLTKGSGMVGTEGWIAPEALKGESTSYPMDVFSLGCLFFYVLTNGSHPYGENAHLWYSKIIAGQYSLKGQQLSHESRHLIPLALSLAPASRPTATDILSHPMLWTDRKKIDFFCEVSDRLEREKSPLLLHRIENGKLSVINTKWIDLLSKPVKDEILEAAKRHHIQIDECSIKGLLRAIRNLRHHYRTISKDARTSLGDGFPDDITYFKTRFPKLLIHVYEAIEWCSNEQEFSSFYSDEVKIRMKVFRAQEEEAEEKRIAEAEAKTAQAPGLPVGFSIAQVLGQKNTQKKSPQQKPKKKNSKGSPPSPKLPTIPEDSSSAKQNGKRKISVKEVFGKN